MLRRNKKKKNLSKKAVQKEAKVETKTPQYLFDTRKLQDLRGEVVEQTVVHPEKKEEPKPKRKSKLFKKKKKEEAIQPDEIEKVDFTDNSELENRPIEKKKEKKKHKPLSLRATNALCAFILALSTLFIYYFSNDSKVRVLACEGNHYYTDTQIYKMAHISKETRLWLIPSTLMESQISRDSLIDSVNVKKSDGKLTIKVKEKLAIAYYIEDGSYHVLTIDGESYEVEETYRKNLIHLPLMTGFTSEQRIEICERLKEKEDKLTHDIIEKISEIVPFTSSYDANMVEFIMRDGNSVFSSLDSLSMLTKYAAVLTRLKGTTACLVLDSSHSAVDKINCEDITTSRKALQDEQVACEADGNTWDSSTNSCQIKVEETEEENNEESDENSEEEKPSGELINYLSTVDDWEYDEFSGYYISYSAEYYYDPRTETYYTYDESIGDFRALTEQDTF